MLKFVLILTLYNAPDAPSVYVLDYNQSGSDCVQRLADFAYIENDIAGARLSCEIDNAIYPAETN